MLIFLYLCTRVSAKIFGKRTGTHYLITIKIYNLKVQIK